MRSQRRRPCDKKELPTKLPTAQVLTALDRRGVKIDDDGAIRPTKPRARR